MEILIFSSLGLDDVTDLRSVDGISFWILTVKLGLEETYSKYPWIAYGTDWLAFGHLIIALFFIPPWLNPSQYRSTLWIGIVACLAAIPLALLCGEIRGIPLYWRLIDCSFGIIGLPLLLYSLRLHLPQKKDSLPSHR